MAKLYLYKTNKPEGYPIRVGNLGVFKNGDEYDIPGNEDIGIAPVVSSPKTGLSSGEKPEEEDS